ncbi:hypothetical protein, partial [Thiolapillus sp.]|uniref:hypothetical protein n=1 Tax=Thiolapillus sp. TaxID=2017437 RepID=UPI003AF6DDCD
MENQYAPSSFGGYYLARHPLPRYFFACLCGIQEGLVSHFQVGYYSRPFVEYGGNSPFLGTRQMTTVSAKP